MPSRPTRVAVSRIPEGPPRVADIAHAPFAPQSTPLRQSTPLHPVNEDRLDAATAHWRHLNRIRSRAICLLPPPVHRFLNTGKSSAFQAQFQPERRVVGTTGPFSPITADDLTNSRQAHAHGSLLTRTRRSFERFSTASAEPTRQRISIRGGGPPHSLPKLCELRFVSRSPKSRRSF